MDLLVGRGGGLIVVRVPAAGLLYANVSSSTATATGKGLVFISFSSVFLHSFG